MKLYSRVALAGAAWEGNSGQQPAARVRLRDDHFPAGTPTVARGSQTAQLPTVAVDDADGQYEISCITNEFDLPHWTGTWRRLLTASVSHEKIYQAPEFFRFLADSRTGHSDQFELFAIRDRIQGNVVGMVPVRLSGIALDAKLGTFSLVSLHRRIIRILGSVPLMPADPALLHQLFAHLLAAFPDCAAVSMQAFPIEMQARLDGDARHVPLLVHGWRGCHTVPLPETLADYMGKLSSKKRYNLARQYRLLEQATGPLELKRIDRSADVRDLVAGIEALATDGSMGSNASGRDYRVLAANRLMLSYVLRSATEVIAVIIGSRYGDTWHVHQIHFARRYRHLSAGSVATQQALQNVIADFAFASADFGFGEPRHSFATTHVLKTRAHVLVTRKGSAARMLFGAFVRYDAWHAACVRVLRPIAQRFLSR